jgi:tetraacyldisaccharide-1-P 4'-kinase
MNEQQFLKLIAGQPMPGGGLLRFLLRVASWPYAVAMLIRNRLFDWGIRRIHLPPVPVISVGNLTTGGTGKTPVVALIVQQLQQAGLKPGIVSRGYRALDDEGNDERRVLDILCPGVPHVQNRDRVAAVTAAVADHGCNVIVADDAFQHRRLGRTLDVVLIDATNPWGGGFVLPRGLLREPRIGLRRAGLIAVTRSDQIEPSALDNLCRDVRMLAPSTPRIEIAFKPTALRRLSAGNSGKLHRPTDSLDGEPRVAAECSSPGDKECSSLASETGWLQRNIDPRSVQSLHACFSRLFQRNGEGRGTAITAGDEADCGLSENAPLRAVVFSGIGNPEAFRATVETLGIDVVAFRVFPDHWHYSEADLTELTALATENSAGLLLTTLKDLVKLRELPQSAVELAAIEISAVVGLGTDVFSAAIDRVAGSVSGGVVHG